MKVVRNEKIFVSDVDGTLVKPTKPGIKNPKALEIYCYGHTTYQIPIEEHVQLLRIKKARGYYIIVWTQNGYAWGEAIVKALKLDSIVDVVMTKPNGYLDDLPCNEWMGNRIFIAKEDEDDKS